MFSKIVTAAISILFLFQANAILIDKIAAVVDEEIITMTDIDKAIQFYPLFRRAGESEELFYRSVLDDLIAYKVVYLEYRDEFTLKEEDYDELQTSVIRKLGSLDELMALLKKFDMEWADFKDFIKERVVYEKVLESRFQIRIDIDFGEIETFYNEEYLPLQRGLDLKPSTLIEMAPLIEKHLRKVRTEAQLSGWLNEIKSAHKIVNKLLEESK